MRTQSFFYGLCFLCAVLNSCDGLRQNEKFLAPVERIIKLDSTQIGSSTILSDLDVPWEIIWGPDDQIWFTEQSGTISKVDPHTGKKKLLLNIVDEVYRYRTLGLLGMAIHPDRNQKYVFINYTHKNKDSTLVSRLVRYTYTMDTLKNPLVLLEIPANTGHNGSRISVSHDGKIFWATGDAVKYDAQDISLLNGKVLRLNIDGSIPKDNPYPASPVWSFGHRNIQGLVFTPANVLFSSEHGDALDDEINMIQKGGNYGWPVVEGHLNTPKEKAYGDSTSIIEPIKAWTPTIAPSGIDFYSSDKIPEFNNSILLATLKATSIRVLHLDKQNSIKSERIYLQNQYGRLRDICVSPAGDIYVSTSNRDWNPLGVPKPHDDRIIRIAKISDLDNLAEINRDNVKNYDSLSSSSQSPVLAGMKIYTNYCASCHKQDGSGVAGTFPSLRKNRYIAGDKKLLAKIVLEGSTALPSDPNSRSDKAEKMPAFNFLSDQQIADVLTFLRKNWDNNADSISNFEIKRIRKQIN